MSWYVYALVDAVPSGRPGRGLSGPLRVRDVAGGFAVVERRADVPPPEFGSLRKHQAVVVRLAKTVPAILPVRFGTLLDDEGLDEALAERDRDVREAFALVRHRVQFTWRRLTWRRRPSVTRNKVHPSAATTAYSAPPSRPGSDPGVRAGSGAGAGAGSGAAGAGAASGAGAAPGAAAHLGLGAEYLRRAAWAANPVPPPEFRTLREKLHAFVVREKFQAAAGGVPDTLYQLIEKSAETRYCAMADAIAMTSPAFTVSGPWPPFAFAPEML
jgi:hypothetical protein